MPVFKFSLQQPFVLGGEGNGPGRGNVRGICLRGGMSRGKYHTLLKNTLSLEF